MIKKKIRIIGTPWHISHQFDLFTALKDDVEVDLIKSNVRHWSKLIRDVPPNVHFVNHYDPKKKYDLALLHLDQQCTMPTLGKSQLFNDLNETITDIPKIILNHGTPMIPEYGYDDDIVINGGTIIKDGKMIKIDGVKKMIGDSLMIVNSHRASERWGFGYTIWHGKDVKHYWDLPKEPRVVMMVSGGGMDKYYNRTFISDLRTELGNWGIGLWQITVDWKMAHDTEFEGFDAYRNFLGRSLIYLNPTKDAPMPRARAEAMLSGCCILTTNNHDEDKFIEHGVNGFIIPDNAPRSVAELVATLLGEKVDEENRDLSYYKELIAIGQKGKETAIKEFSMKKYRDEWMKVINLVLTKGTKVAGKELYEQQKKR